MKARIGIFGLALALFTGCGNRDNLTAWEESAWQEDEESGPEPVEVVAALKKFGGYIYYEYEYGDETLTLEEVFAEDGLERLEEMANNNEDVPWYSGVGFAPAIQCNDEALATLKGLTGLEELDLQAARITNAGLAHLSEMTRLRFLSLSMTNISNAGVAHLSGLTNLKELRLGDTKITDDGLEHLKGMTQLETLSLVMTKVSDDGLERLSELTGLKTLQLGMTRISDAGLAHLSRLAELESLDMGLTKVTAAGVEKLQAALPECEITH